MENKIYLLSCEVLSSLNKPEAQHRKFWSYMRRKNTKLDELIHITNCLKGNETEVFEGLDSLSNLLIFGGGEALKSFPIKEMCTTLVHTLLTTNRLKYKEMTALCIFNVMQCHQGSIQIFYKHGILNALNQSIQSLESNELVENCMSAISEICKVSPDIVGNEIGIDCFFRGFDRLCVASQRNALNALLNVTNVCYEATFSTYLVALSQIIASDDQRAASTASTIFLTICMQTSFDVISTEAAITAFKASIKLPVQSAIEVLKGICIAADYPPTSYELMKCVPIFNSLIERGKIPQGGDLIDSTLDVISRLISAPQSKLPQYVWTWPIRAEPESKKFTIEIQPLLVHLLLDRDPHESKILLLSAASISYNQPEFTPQLTATLYGLSKQPELTVSLTAFLLYIKSPSIPGIKEIVNGLTAEHLKQPQKGWVWRSIAKINKSCGVRAQKERIKISKVKSEADIVNISNMNIPPFEFANSGAVQVLTTGLRSIPLKQTDVLKEALQKIADTTKQTLGFFTLADEKDPLPQTIDELRNYDYAIDIKFGKEEFEDIYIDLSSDLIAIEAYVNKSVFKNVNDDALRKAMSKSPISKLVDLRGQSISCSLFGHLARTFKLPGYKRCTFTINGKRFPAQVPLFHALSSVFDSIDELLTVKPLLTVAVGECGRPSRTPHAEIPPDIRDSLDLMAAIKTVCPSVDTSCGPLTDAVAKRLASPALTAGLYSQAVALLCSYPFVFRFETRVVAFRMISLDMPSVLHAAAAAFRDTSGRERLDAQFVRVHVRRAQILEDGMAVLERIPGNLHIEVDFVGEAGIGNGPTQEFFTLMAREFCRPSLGLWRCSDPGAEFCLGERGLFPSPGADTQKMRLFGVLCGKAVAEGCLIDVPFSTAFFQLLAGRRLRVEDVDESFAAALSDPAQVASSGVDFSYPGLPSLVLKKGAEGVEVTEANVSEYISLVREATVGRPVHQLAQAFREGFGFVIPFDAMQLFEPGEMATVLCGHSARWRLEDLRAHIACEHGFTAESKEVAWLFEVLSELDESERELFTKFVTGNSRLPIGGLGALRPKLTIGKKDGGDRYLPSVMTCTNYFKMPAYSSKEILRERILVAISEGQGAFSFS